MFRGAQLFDGDGPARPATTVVVRGDEIEAIMVDAAYRARPGDRVYDLAGRTLMPGMVQCHFHSHFGAFGDGVRAPALGLEAAPAYLSMLAAYNAELAVQCGFTGAIGSSNAHTIDVSLKEAILAGFVKGPRYLAGSREIVTTGEYSDYPNNRTFYMALGHTGLTYEADGVDGWRLAGRVESGRGCDVVEDLGGTGPRIDAGARHPLPDARRAARAGRRRPQEREARTRPCPVEDVDPRMRAGGRRHHRPRRPDRRRMHRGDPRPRLHASCPACSGASASSGSPSPGTTTRRRSRSARASRRSPAEVRAKIRGVREDYEYTCRAMPEAARAGVRMVVGDDFGTPIMPHGDYIPELELYVKKLGVSPLEVLRWATKNGAEAMGLGDRTGTIAVGKLADLIVVDGDPLTDVSCLANRDNLRVILLGGKVMKDTF